MEEKDTNVKMEDVKVNCLDIDDSRKKNLGELRALSGTH